MKFLTRNTVYLPDIPLGLTWQSDMSEEDINPDDATRN